MKAKLVSGFVAATGFFLIYSAVLGLWDEAMNHPTGGYCLPFCAGGVLPNYIAGDIFVTLAVLGSLLMLIARRRQTWTVGE